VTKAAVDKYDLWTNVSHIYQHINALIITSLLWKSTPRTTASLSTGRTAWYARLNCFQLALFTMPTLSAAPSTGFRSAMGSTWQDRYRTSKKNHIKNQAELLIFPDWELALSFRGI
jgi:hypothetical protein